MKDKKQLLLKIIIPAIIFVVLVSIFVPSILIRLKGNIYSIDEENNNVNTGVIIDTKIAYDNVTNKINLDIYNGTNDSVNEENSHKPISILGYIYRDKCVDAECPNFTTVYLEEPVVVDYDSDYTYEISNAGSLFSNKEINVGIIYSLNNNNYSLYTTIVNIPEFTNNMNGNDGEKTEGTFNMVNSEITSNNVSIKLNDTSVFMDISEDLGSIGITYKLLPSSNDWTFYHPQSLMALTKKIFGNITTANIDDYITYQTSESLVYSNNAYFTLSGYPKQIITKENVIPGMYFVNGANSLSSEAVTYIGDIPQFTLTVYDKSSLKTAIEAAREKLYSSSDESVDTTSWSYYYEITSHAENMYYQRSSYSKCTNYADNSTCLPTDITQDEIIYMVDLLNTYVINQVELANYDNLDAAVTRADALTKSWYTEDTLLTLENYLSKVEKGLTINYQLKIDNLTSNINNAIDSLIMKDADYTAVDTAIARANNYPNNCGKGSDYQVIMCKDSNDMDISLYTSSSWNKLQIAIAIVEREKKINEQTIVDGYANDINAAIDGLQKNSADYSKLNIAISMYEGSVAKEKNWYTADSKAPLDTLLLNIIEGKKIDEQAKVNEWYEAVSNATSNLKYRLALGYKASDEYEPFEGAMSIEEYKIMFNSMYKDSYTSESVEKINYAIEFLDYDEEIEDDPNIYNVTINNQDVLDDELKKLDKLLKSLVKKPGNYTELCKYYAIVSQLNRDYYENIDSLETAMWDLNWNYDIDQQNEIDMQTANFKQLTDDLVMKLADTTKLLEAFNAASSLIPNYYTNFNGVRVAMLQYYDVQNATIDKQAKVDEITAKINSEIKKLVMKPADYTRIEILKAKINQLDKEQYINFEEVTSALNKVVYGKKIDEQAIVNGMYEELKTAYDNLEYRSENLADYSNLKSAVAKIPNDITPYSKEVQKEIKGVINELKEFPTDLSLAEQDKEEEMTTKVETLVKELKVDNFDEPSSTVIINYLKVNGKNIDISTTPFKYSVDYDVNEAKVEVGLASKENTYKVYGGKVLFAGDNEITIIVTTKNNDKYTYRLYITKESVSNYLKNLTVKDNDIKFNKRKEEYTVNLKGISKKLDISAVAEDSSATVDIKGNNDLKNGSKVIIVVTPRNADLRVYTLYVKTPSMFDGRIIILLLMALSVLGGAFAFIQIKNKKKNKE